MLFRSPAREREAAMTLMNQDADVLAFHTGSSAVMMAAQERGKMAIGYHSDMRHMTPEAQLLSVTHHWGDYYTRRVRAVLDGSWKSTDTWGGIKEGMVTIEGFGPRLDNGAKNEVLKRYRELSNGQFKVFKGPLFDASGRMIVPPGHDMTDAEILGMNFLVQGVRQ